MAQAKKDWTLIRENHTAEASQKPNFKAEVLGGYEIQTWNESNRSILRVYRGKSGKPVVYYSFLNDEQRKWHYEMYLRDGKNDQDRIAAISEAKENLENPFKPGDILYDSWGYDQTNIDFYQVTKTTDRSITVREINSSKVEGDHMQGKAVPVNNDFIGQEIRKPLIVLHYLGKTKITIKSDHGAFQVWDGEPVNYTSYA